MKILVAVSLFIGCPAIGFGEAMFPGLTPAGPAGVVLGQDLSRALELKGVTVPLGATGKGVSIHFGSVRVVSKKMGALRIGLIPELEVERMIWTVKSPGTAWCAEIQEFFGREAVMSEANFKGFELVFEADGDFLISAEEAEFAKGTSRLDLRKVVLKNSGRRLVFPEAGLFLEGSQAGVLEIAERSGEKLKIQLPPEKGTTSFRSWRPPTIHTKKTDSSHETQSPENHSHRVIDPRQSDGIRRTKPK